MKPFIQKSILATLLSLSLIACGGGGGSDDNSNNNGGSITPPSSNQTDGNNTGGNGNQTGENNQTEGNNTEGNNTGGSGNNTGGGNGNSTEGNNTDDNGTIIDNNQTEGGNNTEGNNTGGNGNSTEGNQTTGSNVMSDPNYVLPPMPDKELNDSTLLGIDSNNNGVRDDVEIWIYENYKTYKLCKREEFTIVSPVDNQTHTATRAVCEDKELPYHPIVREILMQGARAAQIIIQEPSKAKETTKYMDATQYCNWYFKRGGGKNSNDPILIPYTLGKSFYTFSREFKNIQFNTLQRSRAFGEYNFNLSGGAYQSPNSSKEERAACDFDVDKLLNDYPAENYMVGN